MPTDTPPDDASALATEVAARASPEALLKTQAQMLLWALRTLPGFLVTRLSPEPLGSMICAIEQAGELVAPDPRVLAPWRDWLQAQSLDWATRRAFDSLSDALERALDPSRDGLAPGETDLSATADELVLASALWNWDELLFEASEFGDPDGSNAAQEIVRERDTATAHAALRAILRCCPDCLDGGTPGQPPF